jgi:hypothetical protein
MKTNIAENKKRGYETLQHGALRPGGPILTDVEPPEDTESNRMIRIVLRRPEAVAQVEDLAAIPHGFDRVFTKPYYAHQLRLAGHDWPYIANKLEYKSGYAAEKAVRNWLVKKVEGRDRDLATTRGALQAEAVRLDLDRLDKLMASYWEDAIGGDLPSAQYVLRVIAQRARYIAPENGAAAAITNQINTLVVGGTEAEYVSALLKARASIGPAHRMIDAADDQPDVMD